MLYLIRDDINGLTKRIEELPNEDWSKPFVKKDFKADWWPETLYFFLVVGMVVFGLSFLTNFTSMNIFLFSLHNIVDTFSILFNFLGSIFFASSLFISKQTALKLGTSRYCGETEEENLKLPAVRDRLDQRNWGIAGAVSISVGLILQFSSRFL